MTTKLYELLKTEYLLNTYSDELNIPSNRDLFSSLLCRKKQFLIDDSVASNKLEKQTKRFLRKHVLIAQKIILSDEEPIEKSLVNKLLSAADARNFDEIFESERNTLLVHAERRIWNDSVGVSYGQGVETSVRNVGLFRTTVDWEKYRETSTYRKYYFDNLKYISDDLSNQIRANVSLGVVEGLNPRDIAKGLRKLIKNPKEIIVSPKIVAGKIVRKGFSYNISISRYSEMIARTETNRALNSSRLSMYERLGVQKIEWLTAGDSRVCPICDSLDGQIYDIDKVPPLPRHVSCRCSTVSHGIVNRILPENYNTTAGQDLFANSFVRPLTKYSGGKDGVKLFKSDINKFKNGYTSLSAAEQRVVRKEAVMTFRNIGFTPQYNKKNLNDVADLVRISKQIPVLQQKAPKLYDDLASAMGKLTSRRIRLGTISNKSKVISVGNRLVRIPAIEKNVLGFSSGSIKIGSTTVDLDKQYISIKNSSTFINLLEKAKTDQKVRLLLEKYDNTLYHELGHSYFKRVIKPDLELSTKWVSSVRDTGAVTVTKYELTYVNSKTPSSLRYDEAFAETLVTKIKSPNKLKKKFIQRNSFMDEILFRN